MFYSLRNQQIVITGGAGFIGSATVRYLNDLGYDQIILVDDLGTDEKWKNLVGKRFVTIIPIAQIFSWLKGRETEIGAYIHLGACSDTTEKNADYLLENNFRFSVRLAEIALHHQQRFIYASSAATYGDGTRGFSDAHDTIDELAPLNMYGYSKHLFDQWLLRQKVLDRVVGLKYFNVFGPNENHKKHMASALYKLYPSVQQGSPLRLFQSCVPELAHGEQKRDFIYIKDAVRMTCAFLDKQVGGIFNVGRGEAVSWNRLGRALFRSLDLAEKIEYIPMPTELAGKYQNYTCADMKKTTTVLGTQAACTTIEESVLDYVHNYLIPDQKW